MNFGFGEKKEILDKFNRSKYIELSPDIQHGDDTQRAAVLIDVHRLNEGIEVSDMKERFGGVELGMTE